MRRGPLRVRPYQKEHRHRSVSEAKRAVSRVASYARPTGRVQATRARAQSAVETPAIALTLNEGINVTKNMKNTRAAKRTARPSAAPAYRLRRSRVHGSGLFATRRIPKDTQIIEYVGEHISHEEADRRHADNAADDGHTFLFTIDAKTVIDAGVGGNLSRFINHSCDPSCEVIVDDGRPFVVSLRTIEAGEELAYDYNLTRSPDDPPETEQVFGCRCGAPTCRGTMLAPPKKAKVKVAPKAKAKAKAKASGTKARARAR